MKCVIELPKFLKVNFFITLKLYTYHSYTHHHFNFSANIDFENDQTSFICLLFLTRKKIENDLENLF